MVSTRGHSLVLGGNPLNGSDALDSRMTTCLWDLSRGHALVMEDLMGRHFWVDPRTSWADACDVSGLDIPSTCSHSDDSGGAVAFRSATDSTEQWV
jgi:hypothetical protein